MEIYQPAEDSYLLQKYVEKYAFGRVLDLGTGSGIQALTAVKNKLVREVVAVDINKQAIIELKKQKIRKLETFESNLFGHVTNKFDLIIFNPPYLPQDEGITDLALYGGKKGYEISEKFFQQVSKYLVINGKILFLFSSLTKKNKIEEIINHNLLKFTLLERKRLPMFEELYIYLVEKTNFLKELEAKNIGNVHYLTHGKRGDIFIGELDQSKFVKTHLAEKNIIKVGIKVKREESQAVDRIRNEIKWLKVLNRKGIGPKLLFYGENFFVYKFVEGEHILDWVKKNKIKKLNFFLVDVLKQCFVLDKLGLNKEEMHHPQKHIIINNNNVTLIDFERIIETKKPHNVTQFVEFISRINKNLNLNLNIEKLRSLSKEYKKNYNESFFTHIIEELI